jgi:CheY-like chemotaxis protein
VNILIVEDSADNANTLAGWLRLEGHTVEVYGSAEQVFRRLTDGRPPADAAVVDVRLPGSDGTTVVRAMRVLSGWRDVPVVLTSGAVEVLPGDRPYGGPTVSLAKPFDPPALLAAIARAADMRG